MFTVTWSCAAEHKGKTKAKSKFDAVIGRTVDVPAPIFGVDIPDLYYRGTVLKKDTAHAGKQYPAHSFVVSSHSPSSPLEVIRTKQTQVLPLVSFCKHCGDQVARPGTHSLYVQCVMDQSTAASTAVVQQSLLILGPGPMLVVPGV